MIRSSCLLVAVPCALFAFVLLTPGLAPAVTAGQLDDFNADEQGWTTGANAPGSPNWISTGGPDGVGDGYLQVVGDASSSEGGKIATINESQWTGDFLATGSTRIEMDLKIFDLEDDRAFLDIFILFMGGRTQDPPSDAHSIKWSTTNPISVANDATWHHVAFDFAETDVTLVGGNSQTEEYETVFGNTNRFMIRYNDGVPAQLGEDLGGTIGIDNIHLVPEPSTGLLVSLGLAGLAHCGRVRRR